MNACLNIVRLSYIRKGYVNKKELAQFLDVGKCKATTIYNQIVSKIEEHGKSVDELGIRVSHVLDYLGYTEDDIRRFAQDEEKNGGNMLCL